VLTEADALELDQLRTEVQALRQKVAEFPHHEKMAHFRHHPAHVSAGRGAMVGTPPVIDDEAITQRIIAAYRLAVNTPMGSTDSFWLEQYAQIRQPEHETIMNGYVSTVQAMLRDPMSNNLFYGFDTLAQKYGSLGEGWTILQGQLCYDSLLTLAEAVGTVNLEYPEGTLRTEIPDVEVLLSGLDNAFGFRIEFPNFYNGEVGLETSRGIASYRYFQSLYQAWRIAKFAPGGKVLEIGGGLGRTAYYANKFGITDYTIVDIPLTGVSQAYFLFLTGIPVRLYRESTGAGVRIVPPSVFYESDERYDMIVNVDSFTEMAAETAARYFDESSRRTEMLLSINHEFNQHRIFDLIQNHPAVLHATREPYWLRRGYVHEMISFKP
jgi:hypothetical protein